MSHCSLEDRFWNFSWTKVLLCYFFLYSHCSPVPGKTVQIYNIYQFIREDLEEAQTQCCRLVISLIVTPTVIVSWLHFRQTHSPSSVLFNWWKSTFSVVTWAQKHLNLLGGLQEHLIWVSWNIRGVLQVWEKKQLHLHHCANVLVDYWKPDHLQHPPAHPQPDQYSSALSFHFSRTQTCHYHYKT